MVKGVFTMSEKIDSSPRVHRKIVTFGHPLAMVVDALTFTTRKSDVPVNPAGWLCGFPLCTTNHIEACVQRDERRSDASFVSIAQACVWTFEGECS